jgi:hypothetical protein
MKFVLGPSLILLGAATLFSAACTTVTRSDGSTVRIPVGGVVGSMAATNIACQDNVATLLAENGKLRARIAELEAQVKSNSEAAKPQQH